MQNLKRREFLKMLGAGIFSSGFLSACNSNFTQDFKKVFSATSNSLGGALSFNPIEPSDRDELLLPEGYTYKILRSWGDEIADGIKFGFNNDFTSFFPLVDGKKVNSLIDVEKFPELCSKEGLLWVNHETVASDFVPEEAQQRTEVGGSVIRIKNTQKSGWEFVRDEKYNTRLNADSAFEMTGPVKAKIPNVFGTLANCSGGQTPWMTALSGEENFHFFEHFKGYNAEHFGWIIEVDPYDKKAIPRKHTALGRFAHENAAVAVSPNKKIVVYMGDDKENQHIYKFISKGVYKEGDKENNMSLLTEGDLYVARFNPENHNRGEWKLLSIKDEKLKAEFASQADLLLETRKAASILDATPLNRPEDLEICPLDNSVFIALSKNPTVNDYYGSIMRIVEDENNPESLSFSASSFLAGSKKHKFACPDNFAFDDKGNVWVTTDVATDNLNKGKYAFAKNNALFVIPLEGKDAGVPKRFASAPVGAELTGPWFSPDFKTLFLSIQHPGENGTPSTWPHDLNGVPRSSVVAISGL